MDQSPLTSDGSAEQPPFRFFHRLRVRWAEVDMQAIVFNANYLTYVDTAVTEYWRALALPYADTLASLGGDLFVRKATLQWHAPARFDDDLAVGVCCARIGQTSILMRAQVQRGSDALVDAEMLYVFADPVARRSRPVPQALRDALNGYEAGEPVVRCEVADWPTLEAAARAIRSEVFVLEQGIAHDLEWDDQDAAALHAVAFNRLGRAVGTGRLIALGQGRARIGRMAVLRSVRGAGVGRALLDALVARAQQRGEHTVVLSAQCAVQGFYERAGFRPQGPVFEEAGIAHIGMCRRLA